VKATQEQLATVKEAVSLLDTAERRASYLAGNFPRADKVKDLNARYRWDTYYLAIDSKRLTYDTLRDLNGEQTETVLRRIIAPLTEGATA